MPGITLRDVQKSYGGYTAVTGLDLEVRDGEFLCLLGPSGCGKTTTLRMIAGLENLTGGSLAVGDRVVDCPDRATFVAPEKRGMGLVFQSYALWPHLTIEDNVGFGLKLRKVGRAERKKRTQEVMEALGIAKYAGRYPSQLSGGQQQRVALARMLAVNPSVLLLDEPLSNLDARLRLEMRAELKRIHESFKTTIVFVTHDQWEAMTLADTIAVMNEGTLQQLGTPDDIYERPANRFVAEFVGSPPINILEFGMEDELVQGARRYLGQRHPQISGAGSIGIRPESIRIETDKAALREADFSAPAKVSGILPTGGSWIVELETGGRAMFMNTHVAPRVSVGDRLWLQVPARALNVFDARGVRVAAADEVLSHAAA
ncbi:ABC transporter ATP-binding protein [Wenxinia marina]|uniref:Carbohydrate ABC transporter ATP-binding protein, CUT1 family n=1 Tax=Wenxinia marina DSM 24838 TaxID=1123501 RepID=A0A0D0QD56_9RHOB|nr:ABC transporter ATP-binding protein [Wenxinia marina]KIQ70237.1 carbohydrate ABC transporter ATP-binding protein, CUT1 family [Wenxinia marina DSM 24838]GGL50125.1 ABC transporter ATP-binding protein [Wenxinia marina]